MKKVFATILAIIYLSTSIGANVQLHYCMGKLFSWTLNEKGNKRCGQCGMSKTGKDIHCVVIKGGCCKDTQAFVKLDKDQKASESAYKIFAHSYDKVAGNFVDLPNLYLAALLISYPKTHAPPDPDKVPV